MNGINFMKNIENNIENFIINTNAYLIYIKITASLVADL